MTPVKLPKSIITPSPYFLDESTRKGMGANFMNDVEEFDRMLAAKRMGITWIRMTPSKWKSSLYPDEPGTFLVGRKDKYQGLIEGDLQKLRDVLDWAHRLGLKVMLTFLTVPGRVFAQHNNGIQDIRLWQSYDMQEQALQFFHDVALHIGDHPSLFAFNPINEPQPEKASVPFNDWYSENYVAWSTKIANTEADLNQFYGRAIQSIRRARKSLPIVLDAGFYAHPAAFQILLPHKDDNVYYSFHWYTPFTFSKYDEKFHNYPGPAPVDEHKKHILHWDKTRLRAFLKPVLDWQKKHGVDSGRIIAGEFGIDRLVDGAHDYLKDMTSLFREHGFLHAFYGFREPHFARMDYELGSEKKIWPYWKALEANVSPNYEELRKTQLIQALGLEHKKLKQPLRGFSTWNFFGPNVNEKLVLELMDAMVATGLKDKGYNVVFLDGGWRHDQLLDEKLLQPNPSKFPNGIAVLAKAAHQRGMKFGLHVPIGTKDCANRTPGTFGVEKANAEQLRNWGIDIVKLDQCLLDKSEEWPEEILHATFTAWQHALNGSGIEIIASASSFRSWYPDVVQYGRTTLDLRPKIFQGARFHEPFIGDFLSVVKVARLNSKHFFRATKTYLNDPDMLVIENGLSYEESKSHLAMWVMMNAPLILGNDPRNVSREILALLKNDRLLAIHNDRNEVGRLRIDDNEILVFKKRLQDATTAILFVNIKNAPYSREFLYSQLDLLSPSSIISVFDGDTVHKNQKSLHINLKPHDSALFVVRDSK